MLYAISIKFLLIYVSAPSKVLELNVIESAPNEVTLSWKMPAVHNGEIMNYIVNYIGRKEVMMRGKRSYSFSGKIVLVRSSWFD